MKAVALDRYGGPENLVVREIPAPQPDAGEVLIRVEWAGVGEWDPFEREGGYARMLGLQQRFPLVLGSEGAGTIEAVGAGVKGLRAGDAVCAAGFLNPRGGFYAEYAAIDASLVLPLPRGMTAREAAGLTGVGLTALRGLDDTLHLAQGESLLLFGASGGVGHVALQMARRMGARVFAVASGADGVELARRLGADGVIDGRAGGVSEAAQAFAPDGFDAALFTAGGPAARQLVESVRHGGRIAWPNGVQGLEAEGLTGVQVLPYNGDPDGEVLGKLARLVEAGPFELHVGATFPLEQAAAAHRAVQAHHLGKVVLQVG